MNRIYRDEVPAAFWTARYFRDSQKEEYFVVLRPDGTLHSVHHTLAEAAPGPNLTKEEAEARAENFLRDSKKIDLSQRKLVDAKRIEENSRFAHPITASFGKKPNPPNPSPTGAKPARTRRCRWWSRGDEVSGYRISVHLSRGLGPEAKTRPHSRIRRSQLLSLSLTSSCFLALADELIIFFANLQEPPDRGGPLETELQVESLVVLAAALLRFVSLEPLYSASHLPNRPAFCDVHLEVLC